jgi:hypothetical protein
LNNQILVELLIKNKANLHLLNIDNNKPVDICKDKKLKKYIEAAMMLYKPVKEDEAYKKSILDRFMGKKKTKFDQDKNEQNRKEIIDTTGYFDPFGDV